MTATADAPVSGVSRSHPMYFGRAILGRKRWAKQCEMRRSVWEHRRTIVYSGHSVGKTFELGTLIVEWVLAHPGSRTIVTGPKFETVRLGVWAQVRQAFFGAAARLPGRMLEASWTISDGWDCIVSTADKPSNFQGLRGATVLLVIDEAQGMESFEYVTALLSLVTAEDSRVIACLNPLFNSGWTYDAATSPLWHAIRIDGLEHPNIVEGREVIPGAITQTWVDEMRADFGEDSPEWQSRVRGQFPEHSDSQVISIADLAKGAGIAIDEKPRGGLDVARFGGDRNVFGAFDARRRLVHVESWTGLDTMQTAGRVKNLAQRWGVQVRIDVCGLGVGVYDRLREEGVAVDAVDFGSAPKGDWRGAMSGNVQFKNRRAELHWVTRTLLRAGQVEIGEKFREVRSDLVAPRYSYDGAGKIVVEEKDKLRSRLGRSPDHGDMVHLAMSNGTVAPRVEQW